MRYLLYVVLDALKISMPYMLGLLAVMWALTYASEHSWFKEIWDYILNYGMQ
jgi:hypothetical protein